MKKNCFILFTLFLAACASVGTPSGGIIDKDPPVILKMIPPNETTNFSAKKIEIDFNELIKFKDLRKSLVVSPLLDILDYIKPTVTPSRKIVIDLEKVELKPNTTYTLNFGNCIVDNNEGNALLNFKYVFSTGENIDSLFLGGIISDAYDENFNEETVLMLYEIDSLYHDSLIYKSRPTYFTRLAQKKDSTFIFTNLKSGKYKLVALEDKNSNMRYDSQNEKIGFFPRNIELFSIDSSAYKVNLSLKFPDLKTFQAVNKAKGYIVFPVQGNVKENFLERIEPCIELSDSAFEYILTDEKLDTIRYYYTPKAEDSLLFFFNEFLKQKNDSIKVKIRKNAPDLPFSVKVLNSQLGPKDTLKIFSTKPFINIDTSFINLINKDSIKVDYNLEFKQNEPRLAKLVFKPKENEKYSIEILPEAFKSYLFENPKDTLKASITTKAAKDFGIIKLKISSFNKFPMIVELISPDAKSTYRSEVLKSPKDIFWELVPPGTYRLRLILDSNGNGKYDGGDFSKNIQPEKVYYFKEKLELKAFWEIEQEW